MLAARRFMVFILLFISLPIAVSRAARPVKTWIYFKDKGELAVQQQALAKAQAALTMRSRLRRAKVVPSGQLVDHYDVPVRPEYIRALADRGVQIHNVSKWLNAVSVSGSEAQLSGVSRLPCVAALSPVLCFKQRLVIDEPAPLQKTSDLTALDYGPSLLQNSLMNATAVHDLAITGQGVLVAVFDTGFRLNHEAFSVLHVVAKYDFINKDPNPDLETGDAGSQISHGTQVLSTLAGYSSGNLIGPAFGSDFLLAKTEVTSSETAVEEDYWIAAAEWADSLGADIISSSLGYNDWYTYENMNGNTAPITRAADLAVKKGILVVTAGGNEGGESWKYIMAPADGDSVMAVGAVSSKRTVAAFSSRGPTSDGRIKPDIMAMGVGVSCITVPGDQQMGRGYGSMSGTSAATPLAAGAAALILSAHPDLTPMQVREALLQTADRAARPDNDYGYGIIDVLKAVRYWGDPEPLPEKNRLLGCYPNPFNPGKQGRLFVLADLAAETQVQIDIYNLLGQKINALWQGTRSPGKKRQWSWNGWDDRGERVGSGLYLIRIKMGKQSSTYKITVLN